MEYIIGTWYVEYPDGRIEPCQNRGTAEYLVTNTDAIRIRDITRELMTA
jgi:hypothetical protein